MKVWTVHIRFLLVRPYEKEDSLEKILSGCRPDKNIGILFSKLFLYLPTNFVKISEINRPSFTKNVFFNYRQNERPDKNIGIFMIPTRLNSRRKYRHSLLLQNYFFICRRILPGPDKVSAFFHVLRTKWKSRQKYRHFSRCRQNEIPDENIGISFAKLFVHSTTWMLSGPNRYRHFLVQNIFCICCIQRSAMYRPHVFDPRGR